MNPQLHISLNLVGSSAVNCCPAAMKCFDFVQKVNFFFFPIHVGPVMLMQHEHCQRASRTFAQLLVQFRMIMKEKQLQDRKLLVY